jgi:shikimate kinase
MKIIYLCGTHTAGKTTILEMLKQLDVANFVDGEIGKNLFYERELDPEMREENFEFEVTELELKRDNYIINSNFNCSIVESWHIGNLAHALVRNPDCEERLVKMINTSPLLNYSLGIWLRVSKENIYERTKTFSDNRSWAANFYPKIDAKIKDCFKILNLTNVMLIIK